MPHKIPLDTNLYSEQKTDCFETVGMQEMVTMQEWFLTWLQLPFWLVCCVPYANNHAYLHCDAIWYICKWAVGHTAIWHNVNTIWCEMVVKLKCKVEEERDFDQKFHIIKCW
jgi:hypothetical protein